MSIIEQFRTSIRALSRIASSPNCPHSSPRGVSDDADATGSTTTASASVRADGRAFVWVRARNGTRSPLHAQIIFDKRIGKPAEIISEHVLMPAEYTDDLNTLIARYPAPKVILDFEKEEGRPA